MDVSTSQKANLIVGIHMLSLLVVCVDSLRPMQHFLSYTRTISCLHVLKTFKQRMKCLAEGHNAVPP